MENYPLWPLASGITTMFEAAELHGNIAGGPLQAMNDKVQTWGYSRQHSQKGQTAIDLTEGDCCKKKYKEFGHKRRLHPLCGVPPGVNKEVPSGVNSKVDLDVNYPSFTEINLRCGNNLNACKQNFVLVVEDVRLNYRYKSMFKANTVLEIPLDESKKFYYRIPAFLLTDEQDGRLRGMWELDLTEFPGN
ncbi:dnaJ domain-containing protein [Artemisia annua]|uniref:DnaJ domain-containing protein n=1 Tax=Artemisia annua TaxID=35608 RepID=A0A2U1KLA0_ARTAN|nr:dnaJ domain-containing protein [Artemisia annua]